MIRETFVDAVVQEASPDTVIGESFVDTRSVC